MIKKIVISLIISGAFLLMGCGGDNSYNGEGAVGGVASNTSGEGNAFVSLQENVFKANSSKFLANIQTLKNQTQSFDTNISIDNIITMKKSFYGVMNQWKSVEASYIAGDYDSSMIDLPQFIDYFHTGKKLDVSADIDKLLALPTELTAINKSSSKGINALEYLIFGHQESNQNLQKLLNQDNNKRVTAILLVLDNLETLSKQIALFYESDTKFIANSEDALNSITNVLIDSSFKLKEWRIGDPSGITIKFAGNPNPDRLEQYKSILSIEAINAILRTHQEIMGEQPYENFGSFASENGASSVIVEIRIELKKAQALTSQIGILENAITTSSVDPKVMQLYAVIKELQRLYYDSLIQALNLTAEIIEADGD